MQSVRLGIRIKNDHGSGRIRGGLKSIEVTEVESEVTKWRTKAEPSEMIRHVFTSLSSIKVDSPARGGKRLHVERTENGLAAEIRPLDSCRWNFNASRRMQDVKAHLWRTVSTS
jgi:hypothetical protein